MVTDIGFLACVLPDVHLQMRELKVPLGATRVQTNEWLSLLLRLDRLLLANQVTRLLSDLWDDEGGWVGHSHLGW
jgi:hypothetical protein